MSKFHINKHGVPAPCRAKPGNCPLGGEGEHFNSREEAEEFVKEENESRYGILGSLSPQAFTDRKVARKREKLQELEDEKIDLMRMKAKTDEKVRAYNEKDEIDKGIGETLLLAADKKAMETSIATNEEKQAKIRKELADILGSEEDSAIQEDTQETVNNKEKNVIISEDSDEVDEDYKEYPEVLDENDVSSFMYTDNNLNLFNDGFEPVIISSDINEEIGVTFESNPELLSNEAEAKEKITEIYARLGGRFIDPDNPGLVTTEDPKLLEELNEVEKVLNSETVIIDGAQRDVRGLERYRENWNNLNPLEKMMRSGTIKEINEASDKLDRSKERREEILSKVRKAPDRYLRERLESNPKVVDRLYQDAKKTYM